MAEVRKFTPGSSPIADAVAKAMGENVRPATPGSPATAKRATPSLARPDVFTSATSGFTVPARVLAPTTTDQPSDDED